MKFIIGRKIFDYIDYLGVMFALRVYPHIRLILPKDVSESKYIPIIEKLIEIQYLKYSDLQELKRSSLTFRSNSVTLGEFAYLNPREVDLDDGSYLFEGDEFPFAEIKHIIVKDNHDINEYFVEKNDCLYSKLARMLLTERVRNPLNKVIWGVTTEKQIPIRKGRKLRFHLLGLAHLPTSKEYMSCAFTQKNYKLSKMLTDMGHDVFLYGAEGSDATCTKFIQTHSLKDIRTSWGQGDNRFEIGYDWKTNQFRHDFNMERSEATKKFYANAVESINKTKQDDDFLLVTQGYYHKPIADQVKLHLTCEPGIGYRGSYTKFRAFESTYIQYFTYGSEHPREGINGNFYDRVIPNYYDLKDFPLQIEKGNYFLFMGRLILRKGLEIAIRAVEATGSKLIVAGQIDNETKHLMGSKAIEYVGYADATKRAELMGRARAVFTPSTYLEPFCGVHVEAMLCGTPVITTNFGAFTDYVINGVTGYRCNTLQDFVDASKLVDELNPKVIRSYAKKFGLNSVRLEYERWFQDLYRLYESVKDPNKKAWHHLY